MQQLVTAKEMKEIDRYSIETIGIPSVLLMERAALAVVETVEGYLTNAVPERQRRVLVLAGTGNNGADGLAAARMLANHSIAVAVLFLGSEEKATPEWRLQAEILRKLNIPLMLAETASVEYTKIEDYDVVIDAVFGIGIARPVEGIYREWLDKVNESGTYVVAVDIPSGLSTDTGAVLGTCVRANETVTFGCKKLGMALYPGRDLCGRVRVAEIGFPPVSIQHAALQHFSLVKKDQFLAKRLADANKGSFGKVLLVAGSRNMAGAACFAAKAALAAGAGLVRVLTEEANRQIIQTLVPEAILTTWEKVPEEGKLAEVIDWADIIAAGPGMGCTEDSRRLLTGILHLRRVPLVLDADALNLLAANDDMRAWLDENVILTPHPGELSRLIKKTVGELKENPAESARAAAAQFGCICVCKDAATVTAAPQKPVCVNQSGNEGMATGGSGDVLTGVIAGLLASGCEPYMAAAAGVYIHGLAGDEAKKRYGSHSMGPLQMIEQLAVVFSELERN